LSTDTPGDVAYLQRYQVTHWNLATNSTFPSRNC